MKYTLLFVATALLVTFKLVGAIEWPWLWVFAPLICAAGLVAVGIVLMLIAYICHLILMRDPDYRLKYAFENMHRALRRRG